MPIRTTALASAVSLALGLAPAGAAVLTVTTDTDDVNDVGSLRWAVAQLNANANAGETDEILFAGVSAITLSSPLVIEESLRIAGPGRDALTLLESASGARPMLDASGGSTTIALSVEDLTLTGTTGLGTLISHDNGAAGGGTLSLSGVRMTEASTGRSLDTRAADVIIEDSIISDFVGDIGGGSMNIRDGQLTLRDSTISGNSAIFGSGGAIYLENSGGAQPRSVLIERSELRDNATGGSASYGGGALRVRTSAAPAQTDVTISGSTLSGNDGGRAGAIFLDVAAGTTQTLTIAASVLSDNTASFGVVIGVQTGPAADSTVGIDIGDSTLSGNTADTSGGVFDLRIAAGGGSTAEADVTISGSPSAAIPRRRTAAWCASPPWAGPGCR